MYIAVFGCGSILGMMLIGLVLSLPVVWSLPWAAGVSCCAGTGEFGSVGLGLSMIYRVLMGEPLS